MTVPEPAPPALALTLFGPLHALVQGQPLPHLRSRKTLWLLALLTLRHDRPVAREWLAGTLWPDVDQSQAFANLRPALSELRRALGSQGQRLQSPDRHTLRLDLQGAEVDVLNFDAAIASKKASALEQAAALYRGPLLEGCAEEWVFQERAAREQACLQALRTLADSALAAGDFEAAVGHYQRAVSIDPIGDAARRGWMEALAKRGDRNAALQVYREFVEALHKDDPTAVPDEQTSALYVRLRAEARQRAGGHAVVATSAAPVGAVTAPAATVTGYLPHALTDLVGREDERIEVAARLRRARLVTLTGPGGIGKTRLAIAVATESVEEYADGVWLVALESLTEGRLVAEQIASALGLREEPGRPLLESVTDHLRKKRLLLALDNCEHLLEASAQIAAHLLRECAGLRILATSRAPLGILGETAWAVPALSAPENELLASGKTDSQRAWMDYESVRLFVERAQAVQKNFSLTGSNARAVAQICAQLEGIPLAIELAAVRVKVMTVEQIAARLNDELGLLTGGNRAALPRQQTLRATLDWSYTLLSEAERSVLRRLSVFADGCDLEAAERVCAGENVAAWQVLDLMTSLVDKSLLVFKEQAETGSGRYRLSEAVRQYAAERLDASGEAERVKAGHRDCFLALAEAAEAQLNCEAQGIWLAKLETEHENLRAALVWSRTEPGGARAGVRLVGALWRFWEMRGRYGEGRAFLAGALGREGADARTRERAKALNGAGVLAQYQGDYEAARALHEESLAISRELGNRQGMGWPLHHLGVMASRRGDYSAARARHEESLTIWRELGNNLGIGWSVHQLGSVLREQGEYEAARALYAESLAISRTLGDKQGIAWALNDLGKVTYDQGDYAGARALYAESLSISRELGDKQGTAWSLHHLGSVNGAEGDYETARPLDEESLAIFREIGNKQGVAWTLHHLGNMTGAQGDYAAAIAHHRESLAIQQGLSNKLGVAWAHNGLGKAAYEQGDFATARARFAESLSIQRELGDRRGAAESLEGLAAVTLAEGEAQGAARLWGAADALRETIGSPLPRNAQAQHAQQLERARSLLGADAFAAAWEEGRAPVWEQAIAAVLTGRLPERVGEAAD